MFRLLRTFFSVPESQMTLLCDQDATRQRVIEELNSFHVNPSIQQGDAIFIYFAGYGSRARTARRWEAHGGTADIICPVDDGCRTEDGEIHGIPDRTIAGILYKTSVVKSGNIVSFTDQCAQRFTCDSLF